MPEDLRDEELALSRHDILKAREPYAFAGADYQPERDNERLLTQLERVKRTMRDGKWRTLDEISTLANAPASSVSAQLRHLRKPRYGSHKVERRHEGNGLYSYRLVLNEGEQ